MRNFCLAAMKAVISSLVFGTCVLVVLHYSGAPVPSPAELLHQLEGLTRLAKILS
jgi:hypothetical protein